MVETIMQTSFCWSKILSIFGIAFILFTFESAYQGNFLFIINTMKNVSGFNLLTLFS